MCRVYIQLVMRAKHVSKYVVCALTYIYLFLKWYYVKNYNIYIYKFKKST